MIPAAFNTISSMTPYAVEQKSVTTGMRNSSNIHKSESSPRIWQLDIGSSLHALDSLYLHLNPQIERVG